MSCFGRGRRVKAVLRSSRPCTVPRLLLFPSAALQRAQINASLSEADGILKRVSLKGIHLQMGSDR